MVQVSESNEWLIGVVLFLIVFDYGSGIAQAIKNSDLRSDKMRSGLWHKLGFVLSMVLAVSIDIANQHVQLPYAQYILPAVCIYLIVTEVTSILENLKELSPELGSAKFLGIFATTNLLDNSKAEHQPQHSAETAAAKPNRSGSDPTTSDKGII